MGADRLFHCLIFNASCLLSEVAVTVGSCHIDLYPAQRKSERAHYHHHHHTTDSHGERPVADFSPSARPPGKFARAVLLVRNLILGGISMTREEGIVLGEGDPAVASRQHGIIV